MTSVHCEHLKAFYFPYKENKLKQKEDNVKSLLSRGKVCREAASDPDMITILQLYLVWLGAAYRFFNIIAYCTPFLTWANTVVSVIFIPKPFRTS